MSVQIFFITGGARSGKSSFAMSEAGKVKGRKAYIATAQALDEEMHDRILRHRQQRSAEWDTYEEPLQVTDVLEKIMTAHDVVLLDCLTLWLSNLMIREPDSGRIRPTVDEYLSEFVAMLQQLKGLSHDTRHASRLFIVSNEVGMGIVPENELARKFRDHAGILNQKIAAIADEVYLVTAGIPVKIKERKQ
ncbi:MAG: bifunctional adenosylcobinamide kinase/adenosylcobinamide-phosphate guanylyltransferase [Nitrospiraceae bacterium]|nr:MAG: bifunctional adenosylcobinamide kinase/adenosylcobinamide-phosphate guanylyltransferase [Nitrospiraceae bacterium]